MITTFTLIHELISAFAWAEHMRLHFCCVLRSSPTLLFTFPYWQIKQLKTVHSACNTICNTILKFSWIFLVRKEWWIDLWIFSPTPSVIVLFLAHDFIHFHMKVSCYMFYFFLIFCIINFEAIRISAHNLQNLLKIVILFPKIFWRFFNSFFTLQKII